MYNVYTDAKSVFIYYVLQLLLQTREIKMSDAHTHLPSALVHEDEMTSMDCR